MALCEWAGMEQIVDSVGEGGRVGEEIVLGVTGGRVRGGCCGGDRGGCFCGHERRCVGVEGLCALQAGDLGR